MSHKFTDNANREWDVVVDGYSHEQVKVREGVLLVSLADNHFDLLRRFAADIGLLINVLWVLCEEQAASKGVIDDDKGPAAVKFAKSLGGDSLESATNALVSAVIDFFQNQEQRSALRNLMEKAKKTTDILQVAATKEIEDLNPEQLAKNFIDSYSSSRPSLESTLSPAG